jgi:ubiquinone/menaquinone biosynthesis C-methylase UbiE
MVYLDAPQRPQAPAQNTQNGARKFTDQVARGYDAKREQSPKWIVEQKVITDMLSDLPRDTVVLDCPVGTGRFIPFYAEKGFQILGMDISKDMLIEASKKEAPNAKGDLVLGDILKTGLPDKCVDVAVNCRITRWVIGEHGPEGIRQMLKEMQRVTRKRIILTARVANHQWAVSEDLIKSALDGWQIVHNVPGYVLDYRIIGLGPIA